MKVALIILMGTLLGLTTLANDGIEELIPRFKIVSDTYDPSVPDGFCKVKGKVTLNKQPVRLAKISTIDQRVSVISGADGTYEFTISERDSSIYLFKSMLTEVVIYSYDFKSGHVVTIDFMPEESGMQIMVEKPVVYLYSEKKVDAKVALNPKGELAFTYPEYNTGWDVTVQPDGTIWDNNKERSYPYLFWEAKQDQLQFVNNNGSVKGSLVRRKEVIPFLEKQLTNLGLNQKEQTDFITYWGPRLMENELSQVQFLVNEEVKTAIGDLTISPKPESMIRVYMLYAPAQDLDDDFHLVPQTLSPIQRNGFTVVEWGGSEIQNTMNYEN